MSSSGRTADDRFIAQLVSIVGRAHVLTDPRSTARFRTGFRCGGGPALAVVQPHSLVALWRVLQACVAAGKIVIMQAANTGLTGGSTPDGDDYDRDVVIVSPMAVDAIHVIDEGRQVICLPGATLYALEAKLRPYGREPHSVIGSSCIGASVMGGICNNSGGALVQRGPAYTELALYAQVGADGRLRLVNHLGIKLDGDPEAVLDRIERGAFAKADVVHDLSRCASDQDYERRVRDIESPVPARFNADPDRLFEASGCAGKLALFAVRLDTFPRDERTAVFYIGTNRPAELTQLRRHILSNFDHLPIAGEYLHRDCFNIAAAYGKDTYLAIRWLGTDRLPALYRLKARTDAVAEKLGFTAGFTDRWLQRLTGLLPEHLPKRMKMFRARYEHHLILRMADTGIDQAACLLQNLFPSDAGDFFQCSEQEASAAFLHRFAAAGAAVRYRQMHPAEVEDIVALDIALPRNTEDWFEILPDEVAEPIIHKLYYGHFFCHVFHQDYIVRKGTDPVALEHRMWALLDAQGAEYPAEHNVGHLYRAKPALADFYRSLDPTNSFNPGIGHTSRLLDWN
nr:D-lactate dehydrogenase [Novosphingobium mathurense]